MITKLLDSIRLQGTIPQANALIYELRLIVILWSEDQHGLE